VTNLDAIEDARAEAERYRRLLRRDPTSLRFAEYAERLRRAGKVTDATAICARGLMHHPGYATGHAVMGEIFRDAGLMDKAEQEWREALRLDPRHPRAHLCLGELHRSRGDLAQAAASFETAVALNPHSSEARDKLAELSESPAPGQTGETASPLHHDDRHREPARPPLSAEECGALVDALCRTAVVEAAALTDAGGTPVAGHASSSGVPDSVLAAAVSLTAAAKNLTSRLGAGRIRGVLLRGSRGGLRCVPVGDLTMIATLDPKTPPGEAAAATDAAIAEEQERARAEEGSDERAA
jgi:tetratricopeptide (TPR) repeat protein